MSFLFRNINNNNKLPNSDVPVGVNLKFTNLGKPKEGLNEGYNSQKLYETNANKTRSTITKSGRPGAGWEDDDDEEINNTINQNNGNKSLTFNSNNGKQSNKSSSNTNNTENAFYSVESLSEQNIEHEIKIISEIIQPQGARVKPQDSLLISFGKACESLKTETVGSILLSNLTTEVAWLILMKTLYAIEFLIKNYQKYYKYFQIHKNILTNIILPQEEGQASQVNNLNNNIISILENQTKIEKVVYQDDLYIKNLASIQVNKGDANDLLDMGVKKETDSNKKKLNAFDMFKDNKPNTSNQVQYETKKLGNQLLQTQTIDILDVGDNNDVIIGNNFPYMNPTESTQNQNNNNTVKRKFKFIDKEGGKNEILNEQPKKEATIKQNKFDPFSIPSSKNQEKPLVKNSSQPALNESETKKKAFAFVDNKNKALPNTTNANSLLDLNFSPQQNNQPKPVPNSINLTPSPNIQSNFSSNLNSGNNVNFSTNSQIPLNPQQNNLPQKTSLNNLYSNYPAPNMNPMMNAYFSQMNMNPAFMAMQMNPMNNNMNMNMMNYQMNMMGPMMSSNPNMNMMNQISGINIPPAEINKTLEKKENKKVIDESAFDFIKF